MIKKIFIALVFSLVLVNLVSAINLDVSASPVSNAVITDLNKPAVFDLTIRNLGDEDDFEIYSLVGVDITPASFHIQSGETKVVRIKVMPQEHLKMQKGFFTFEYKIKDSKNEIQKEKLTINIIGLEEAFSISPGVINPNSKKISVEIKNKVDYDFDKVKLKLVSAFFEYEGVFELKSKESIDLDIELDLDKLKNLQAGNYFLNSVVSVDGKSAEVESIIKFLEKQGIESVDTREGFLIRRHEITKINVGNVAKNVNVVVEKNVFSYIFTTFNIVPDIERDGFKVIYSWDKELIPNEELKIVVKTNWLLPLIIILFVILLFVFIKRYVESDLILSKKVSFVKTKGGEFALKVTLKARAKSFIEKVHIVDKLPPLVKLYERFGAVAPDKIDLKNRRLEWNVESLNKGEERVFSYIIYSKIGIVGKFELPSGKVIYEKEGKIKGAESNRSFYINDVKG